MSALDTLKEHLDAARAQITESDLFLKLMREADVAFRANEAMPREYLRLDSLAAQIFETAALMSDDDIAEMLDTIANKKDVKMAEYKLPAEPDGPLWDEAGSKWMRSKENMWYGGNQDMYLSWGEVVHYAGPLTTTPPNPPIKVGDTGLTAEQVWGLPEGSVIWPELAEDPEPWMRYGDRWESISEFAGDAGELQCACGDGFTVLRLGGGEE